MQSHGCPDKNSCLSGFRVNNVDFLRISASTKEAFIPKLSYYNYHMVAFIKIPMSYHELCIILLFLKVRRMNRMK